MFCELVTGTHEKGVQGKEGRGGEFIKLWLSDFTLKWILYHKHTKTKIDGMSVWLPFFKEEAINLT